MKKVLLVTTFLLMSLFANLAMAVDAETDCTAGADGNRDTGTKAADGDATVKPEPVDTTNQ